MRSIIPDLPVLAVLVILFLYSRSHRSGASVFHRIFRELLAVSILGVILEIAVFSAENGHLSTTSFRILYTFYCASKPLLFALRVCYGIFRCYAPDMQPITRQTRHTFLFYGQFLLLEFYGTIPDAKVLELLRREKVRDAIRLDGGGSCQMIYDDELVNRHYRRLDSLPADSPRFSRDAVEAKRSLARRLS